MKHQQSCMLILLVAFSFGLQAQTAVLSSGGDASGSGGSISYSIGQVVYTTASSSTATLTQGVQQPYEIFVVIGIEEANDISLHYDIYPNPVNNLVILKVDDVNDAKIRSLHYHLYDITGNLLESKCITENETEIAMGNYTKATYFLKITDDNKKEWKTFKVIKN
ncbi:MAG: T9SS type A sorting domain-containing protein [Bacteroidales bacterium]